MPLDKELRCMRKQTDCMKKHTAIHHHKPGERECNTTENTQMKYLIALFF